MLRFPLQVWKIYIGVQYYGWSNIVRLSISDQVCASIYDNISNYFLIKKINKLYKKMYLKFFVYCFRNLMH